MYRTSTNTYITAYRKKQASSTQSVTAEVEGLSDWCVPSRTPLPVEVGRWRHFGYPATARSRALQESSESSARGVISADVEGFAHKEIIVEIMGTPIGHGVMSRLHRSSPIAALLAEYAAIAA